MRAFCLIRADPVYRREAFVRGLRAVGYDVVGGHHQVLGKPGDVLVIWNRYGEVHEIACRFEKLGGVVLVAENAFLANDRSNRQRYAIARDGHNGSGWWPMPTHDRWTKLGIELKPWQWDGRHILVCPNRSFGMPGFVMPPDWVASVVNRLSRITKRPVRVRPHPGNAPAKKPLAEDFRNAWAVVIWSSSVGCEALVEGIPVFCEAPWWICKGATKGAITDIENPCFGSAERLEAMERLAWAQWHVEEIESGEPFQHLCVNAPAFAGRV
jgi:hypothetical protein